MGTVSVGAGWRRGLLGLRGQGQRQQGRQQESFHGAEGSKRPAGWAQRGLKRWCLERTPFDGMSVFSALVTADYSSSE